MIANFFWGTFWMSHFEQSQASNLVQIVFLFFHYHAHFRSTKTISWQELSKLVFAKWLERTSVVLSWARCLQIDYLLACPWPVVISLAFLAITMPDIVRIVLFKLFRINLLTKFLFPELQRIVNWKT